MGRQWQLVSQDGLRGGKTVAACVTRWAERWEDSGSLYHKMGRQCQLVSQGGLRGGKTVAACVTRWAERWEDSGSLCHKMGLRHRS